MLRVVPCNLSQANAAISAWHRHHSPINDAILAVAVADGDGVVRGVAVVGRPATHSLEDGYTCEVKRVATDGARNACSMLYGACRRAAFAIGYRKIQTYTLPEEGGASLRGAGWAPEHTTDGRSNFSRRVAPRRQGSRNEGRRVGTQARADRARQQGVKTRWASYTKGTELGALTFPAPPEVPSSLPLPFLPKETP